MAVGDGNGWVRCHLGHHHWGLHGAAGLLLVRPGDRPDVLLQLRAGWTHEGGRWGLVGGAMDSHESVAEAALREAEEEAGIDRESVRVVSERVLLDHGEWRYTYVFAVATAEISPYARTTESDDVRWVPRDEVPGLPETLHAGLARAWPDLGPDIDGALSAPAPGPGVRPAGPGAAPTGPSAAPAGTSAAPAGPSAAPAGPSAAPAGPSAAPAGPSAAPAGPGVGSAGSGVGSAEPGVPAGPGVGPGGLSG